LPRRGAILRAPGPGGGVAAGWPRGRLRLFITPIGAAFDGPPGKPIARDHSEGGDGRGYNKLVERPVYHVGCQGRSVRLGDRPTAYL
jgi:hypothetical protein